MERPNWLEDPGEGAVAKKKKKSPIPAKFKVGDKVRVKHGIKDVEYPDMPLGGWAGTITEIHKDGMYTIRWSHETLAAIHPVFKKRSEKDGTVLEEYWLGDDDWNSIRADRSTSSSPRRSRPSRCRPRTRTTGSGWYSA